ncbi:Bet v1-like protein [Venustampulla echinocandica]|uniref:Bet v1-like protein n=1 Tax=Venustampulla echinocandica TaxID=2656787 RepID=A0A370TYY1_9HELO|nr:Bet v1-like protein [Venustampulla echinocandica]RDL40698.1 Bet v1-like protein [Venustampulla echinocandica]
MAALHDALKTLGPLEFSEAPLDNLKPFLFEAFSNGQLIVDSVPIPPPPENLITFDGRSRCSSTASSAAEIKPSSARSTPPPSSVQSLQNEWKSVKLNAKDNPLGMSVYKLGGKDGKGCWFARRSVHEGLGFTKWRKAVEREFPESMKVQGGPGEGNIRGIGGEKRVAYKNLPGVGKMGVYLLSAQFPGPTTPRDFVTMFLTSDQTVVDESGEVLRQFMVISKPCIHPDTPPRDGYIRGQYESVEFIREVPIKKGRKKSASTANLLNPGNHSKDAHISNLGREAMLRNVKRSNSSLADAASDQAVSETDLGIEGRARGKTISYDRSRSSDPKGDNIDEGEKEEEIDGNPVEWIMVTRSDPGGSVPRFMIERGTPSAIVADASKLLDWACAKNLEDFEDEDVSEDETGEESENHEHKHHHENDVHDWQMNGHLAGIQEAPTPMEEKDANQPNANGGIYGVVAGVAGAASGFLSSHAPQVIQDHLPTSVNQSEESTPEIPPHRASISTIGSDSSVGTFASALERRETEGGNEAASIQTNDSQASPGSISTHSKELARLEEKKRKLDEKLTKTRERELSKKSEDSAKEEEAIRRATERHEREIKKQEAKYRREVEKLEERKERERRKVEEKKRKIIEKDERLRLTRELEEHKAELNLLRKENDILRTQVGELQAENTALAAKLGRFGMQGDDLMREVKQEVGKGGRLRASSLKSTGRTNSFATKSAGSSDKEKESLRKGA